MRASLGCIAPVILLVLLPTRVECFTGLAGTPLRRAGLVRAVHHAPSFATGRPTNSINSRSRSVLALEATPDKATMMAKEATQEDPYVVEAALVEEDKAV